jgi:hypothetical protein
MATAAATENFIFSLQPASSGSLRNLSSPPISFATALPDQGYDCVSFKTARTLGIEVPLTMQACADEVMD